MLSQSYYCFFQESPYVKLLSKHVHILFNPPFLFLLIHVILESKEYARQPFIDLHFLKVIDDLVILCFVFS